MKRFDCVTSRFVHLPQANIDTDQITPARFLISTQRDGFGRYLFHDWRFDAEGHPRTDCPLNAPQARGAQILVAGPNFGCGSSREHAAWAILEYGFRVVLSTSIADIFSTNALKVGILVLPISQQVYAEIISDLEGELSVDLRCCEITIGRQLVRRFEIEPFARRCLLNGHDHLDFLLSIADGVAGYEQRSGNPRVSRAWGLSGTGEARA